MADKKIYRCNAPLKSRTKRQQLISSASSLSSLFGGIVASSSTANQPSSTDKQQSKSKMAKKPNQKQKEGHTGPQKERWLLTRKTWKYMADAGRRLIPEGMQHRSTSGSQDLKKIEEYFQHVCRSEPKFLPWRRKQSYPGAMGTSLRRSSKRRTIASRMFGRSTAGSASAVDNKSGASSNLSSPPTKANSADESEDELGYSGIGGDENHKMFLMIRMLEKYLKISDKNENVSGAEYDNDEYNDDVVCKSPPSPRGPLLWQQPMGMNTNTTTSPTYSVLSDEDLVFSRGSSIVGDNDMYNTGHTSISPPSYQNYPETSSAPLSPKHHQAPHSCLSSPTSSEPSPVTSPQKLIPSSDFISKTTPSTTNSINMHTSLLLESLRNYSRTSRSPLLSNLTPNVLQDKQLLRRIRDELKQQQLERIFRRHGPSGGLRTSSSMFTLPFTSSSSLNLTSNTPASKSSSPHRKQYDEPDIYTRFSATSNSSSNVRGADNQSRAKPKSESLSSRISSKFHSQRFKLSGGDSEANSREIVNLKSIPDNNSNILSRGRDGGTYAAQVPLISVKSESQDTSMLLCSSGTQTDPIPLNNIYQLHEKYKEQKKSEQIAESAAAKSAEAKEIAQSKTINPVGKTDGSSDGSKHSRRKSSIDNEDVSQSVSDTIKRYLRMARKKSSNANDANRFKRINYDTNLRNIKPKGEIPKPDELDLDGNVKNTQTNEDWILLVIDEISLYMASRSSSPTDDGHTKLTVQKSKSASTSPSHSSPPSPSPGGLLQTSTQFLSSLLWHSNSSNNNNNNNNLKSNNNSCQSLFCGNSTVDDDKLLKQSSTNSSNDFNTCLTASKSPSSSQREGDEKSKNQSKKQAAQAPSTSAMQKSKSSSNVGQVFSKKIWKSRSKSQTRPDSPAKSHWSPQGGCVWASSNGKQIHLKPVKLQELTDVERKSLHRVAVDRISQLNIGVTVKAPSDSAISDGSKAKPQKRRAPLLLKRKALTTGFFDTSKIKNDGNKGGSGSGLIFGQPLEKCLSNDISKLTTKQSGSNKSGRSSRSSITSLLDNQFGGGDTHGKESLGSCESLFSKQEFHFGGSAKGGHPGHSDEGCGSSFDDEDASGSANVPSGIQRAAQQQVPPLVIACIDHLSMYGLNVVGIFRVSTSKRRIRELREELDRGSLASFDSEISPHDVASLLKEYFRDLPEPLMCRSLYPAFLSTQKIRNRRLQLEALSHIIQLLPLAHRDTLYVLLKFLAHVARCSDDIMNLSNSTCISVGNKMDSSNLATVIAPNILHCNAGPSAVASDEEAEERLDVINVVRTMIDHYDELFTVPADVINDVYTTMMDTYPQQLDYLCDRKENAFANSYRREEDIDSETSSKTTSPPPFQKVVFGSFTHQIENPEFDSSRNKAHVQEAEPPRRIYVREEFTHENSAKLQTDGTKRRERSSKMKYQQPEHELLSRRRRIANSGAAAEDTSFIVQNYSISKASPPVTPTRKSMKGHSSSIDSNASSGGSSSLFYSDSPMRRLSSPYVSHQVSAGEDASDVVTASLKLPVQMAPPTTLNLGADLPDIPYIEDGEGCTLGNTQVPLRQSKSTSNADHHGSASNRSIQNSSGQQQLFHIPIGYDTQYLNISPGQGNVAANDKASGSSIEKSISLTSMGYRPRQQDVPIPYSTEPKLTASITNIGGDVMRSKTADFERLLMQKNRRSLKTNYSMDMNSVSGSDDRQPTTIMASGGQQSGISAERSSSHSSKRDSLNSNLSGTTKYSSDSTKRPGTIYKRRDVISSAQTSKK